MWLLRRILPFWLKRWIYEWRYKTRYNHMNPYEYIAVERITDRYTAKAWLHGALYGKRKD